MDYSVKIEVGIFTKIIYYSAVGIVIGAASYAANRLIQKF